MCKTSVSNIHNFSTYWHRWLKHQAWFVVIPSGQPNMRLFMSLSTQCIVFSINKGISTSFIVGSFVSWPLADLTCLANVTFACMTWLSLDNSLETWSEINPWLLSLRLVFRALPRLTLVPGTQEMLAVRQIHPKSGLEEHNCPWKLLDHITEAEVLQPPCYLREKSLWLCGERAVRSDTVFHRTWWSSLSCCLSVLYIIVVSCKLG